MANAEIQILVVEDNPGDVYLIRESLAFGSIPKKLHIVTDGEAALQFLRRLGKHRLAVRPDLVLLDLNLPRINGREVLEDVKADPELRSIPIIVLSTSKSETDIDLAYENHANCYLTKPSQMEDFFELIQQIEAYWLNCVALRAT